MDLHISARLNANDNVGDVGLSLASIRPLNRDGAGGPCCHNASGFGHNALLKATWDGNATSGGSAITHGEPFVGTAKFLDGC